MCELRPFWAHLMPTDTWTLYKVAARGTYPTAERPIPACRDATASLASDCLVSKGCMVGAGSVVGSGTRLERCIIGSNCSIGRGSALQGSCLHSHVRVEDGVKLSMGLLADQVVVRSHAKIEVRKGSGVLLLAGWEFPAEVLSNACLVHSQSGTLLAKHTVIDSAHCVPAGSCVALAQQRGLDGAGSEDEQEWKDGGEAGRNPASTTSLSLQ